MWFSNYRHSTDTDFDGELIQFVMQPQIQIEILWELILYHESIYLHRTGPLLENGLDRPENRYGRYGCASFSSISTSTIGVDGARVSV